MSEISFSFDSPRQAVDVESLKSAIEAEAGDTFETAPQGTPVATPEVTSRPAAETTPTEVDTPAATLAQTAERPASPEDLKTFKIVVDGQELEVTEADLKSGHMRHRDYTQKTQRLADQERALAAKEADWQRQQAALQTELSQIDQFLRDKAAIDAYRQRAFGPTSAEAIRPPQIDPNKPMTAADVADIARYNAEQVRLHTERQLQELRNEHIRMQQTSQAAAKQAQDARNEQELDSHLKTVLAKYPTLKRFDGIEEDLINDATRFQPRSLNEAKVRLVEAAERRMATVNAISAEDKKQAAVQAAKLKQTSSEQPGGTAPRAPRGKALSMDYRDKRELLAAAEADVRAIMGQ